MGTIHAVGISTLKSVQEPYQAGKEGDTVGHYTLSPIFPLSSSSTAVEARVVVADAVLLACGLGRALGGAVGVTLLLHRTQYCSLQLARSAFCALVSIFIKIN